MGAMDPLSVFLFVYLFFGSDCFFCCASANAPVERNRCAPPRYIRLILACEASGTLTAIWERRSTKAEASLFYPNGANRPFLEISGLLH
jgi:hypothetical protein